MDKLIIVSVIVMILMLPIEVILLLIEGKIRQTNDFEKKFTNCFTLSSIIFIVNLFLIIIVLHHCSFNYVMLENDECFKFDFSAILIIDGLILLMFKILTII